MKPTYALPPPPAIAVSSVGEPDGPPFLIIMRQVLRARYPDGSRSYTFGYDSISRKALDAVVIVAWERVDQELCVYLRSGVRPPLLGRAAHPAAGDRQADPGLWELAADLIEPGDLENAATREQGIVAAASRKLEEELGLVIAQECFRTLGHGVLPSPAMTAEKQFFVSVNFFEQSRHQPVLDGSPLEEYAAILLIPLSYAFSLPTWPHRVRQDRARVAAIG